MATNNKRCDTEPRQVASPDNTKLVDVIQDTAGVDRLAVDSVVSFGGSSAPVPCLPTTYRVDWSDTNINFSGASWQQWYSYTGSGVFLGFHADTDKNEAEFRILIDGQEIFEGIAVEFIKDIEFKKDFTFFQNGNLFSSENEDLDFSPRYPICFASGVQIFARKQGGGSMKIKRYLVHLTKE
jgi:hypothetical protein